MELGVPVDSGGPSVIMGGLSVIVSAKSHGECGSGVPVVNYGV